jgi:NitT/TauT family transport system permease protein
MSIRRPPQPLFSFRKAVPRWWYLSIAVSSVLIVLTLWWALAAFEYFPSAFFPSPLRVFNTGITMFTSQNFIADVFVSCARIGVAFLLSALLAIPLGILMSSFKTVEAFAEPIVDFVRYVPVPALLPIFVLWTGIGETSKLLVLFFGTFFQLVLIIMDDADNVPGIYFDLARTMGASTSQLMRDVLVPYMLPQIYDRLRITLGWCWTYLVIAELIAVHKGIGHSIKEAQRFNAADQLFVCFLVLGLIGLFTDFIAKFFYGRLFPYAAKSALHH